MGVRPFLLFPRQSWLIIFLHPGCPSPTIALKQGGLWHRTLCCVTWMIPASFPCPRRDPRGEACHLPLLLPPPAICPLAEAGRPVLKEWLSPGRGVTPEASVRRCGGLLQGWLVGYQVAEPLTWLRKNQDSRLHAARLRAVWTLGPNTVCLWPASGSPLLG